MNVLIAMTREQCRRDKEFVIYNYIASQIKVTPEKEVEKIISEYVRAQILSPRLRYYIRKG